MATRRTDRPTRKHNRDDDDKKRPPTRKPNHKPTTGKELLIRKPLASLTVSDTTKGEDKKHLSGASTTQGGDMEQSTAVIATTDTTEVEDLVTSHVCRARPSTKDFVAVFKSKQAQMELIIEEDLMQNVVLLNVDKPDKEDPFACTDYVNEIHSHMMSTETREVYHIPETFLSNQPVVTTNQRSVLVDWLVQVQMKYSLLQETLYIAIDILDRYLSLTKIQKEQLQLTGVTSLLIAGKYEEIYPPCIADYVYICADTYSNKEVLHMERDMLRTLSYELNKPYPLQFLRRYSKITSSTIREHGLAKYILEQGLLDSKLSIIRPSMKAASALLLAKSILQRQPIDGAVLYEYTGYTCDELKETMLRLKSCLEYYKKNKLSAIRKKYESGRFLEIAKTPELNPSDEDKLSLQVKIVTTTSCKENDQ